MKLNRKFQWFDTICVTRNKKEKVNHVTRKQSQPKSRSPTNSRLQNTTHRIVEIQRIQLENLPILFSIILAQVTCNSENQWSKYHQIINSIATNWQYVFIDKIETWIDSGRCAVKDVDRYWVLESISFKNREQEILPRRYNYNVCYPYLIICNYWDLEELIISSGW